MGVTPSGSSAIGRKDSIGGRHCLTASSLNDANRRIERNWPDPQELCTQEPPELSRMAKADLWKIRREFRRIGYQVSHPQLLGPYIARKIMFRLFGDFVDSSPSDGRLTRAQKISLKLLGGLATAFTAVDVKGRGSLAAKRLVLAPQGAFVCEEPRCVQQTSKSASGEFPQLTAAVLKKVTFSPFASTLMSQNTAYVPDYYVANSRAVMNDGHFLLWQGADGIGLMDIAPPQKLDRGICLFGLGVENWYHWLIEILPAAYFAQRLASKYDDYPFLVPRRVLEIPQFSEALQSLLGGREILPLDKKIFRVGELVVIDQMVREPINMRVGHWPQAGDYAYNPDLMLDYR
ncbi:hypothetical protein [Roseovarius sp.]